MGNYSYTDGHYFGKILEFKTFFKGLATSNRKLCHLKTFIVTHIQQIVICIIVAVLYHTNIIYGELI